MSTNLSNANNGDEQNLNPVDEADDLQKMFEASYAGNEEESSRLQKSATDNPTDQPTEPADPADPVEEEPLAISSTDMNEEVVDPPAPEESSTEDLAALRDQLHRARSDAGRVPHLNRRVQELERQLKSLRSPAEEPDITTDDIPAKLKTRLDKMREIDPETAELMEEMYRANAASTNEVRAAYQRNVKLQQEREEQEHLHIEYQKVVSAVPEAEAVFRSKEWNEWKSKLSPAYQAMADSVHANEVLSALQAFKIDANNYYGGYKWGKPAQPAAPVEPQISAAARAADTSRAARLTNSAVVRTADPARATAELDMEALFKAAFEDGIKDYPGAK